MSHQALGMVTDIEYVTITSKPKPAVNWMIVAALAIGGLLLFTRGGTKVVVVKGG